MKYLTGVAEKLFKTTLIHSVFSSRHFYFRFFISLCLVLSPPYGFSQEGSSTEEDLKDVISILKSHSSEEMDHLLENLSEEEQTSLRRIRQIYQELTSALDRGEIKDYLESHSDVVSELDYHQLKDQKATRAVDGKTIDFNQERTNTYPTKFVDIEVGFDKDHQMIFEGLSVKGDKGTKRKVGITHTFERVLENDVVSYTKDQEFLVILHRERGLVVYDMKMALMHLGEMPMPSIVLDGEIFQQLTNTEQITDIEFIPSRQSYKGMEIAPDADSVRTNQSGEFVLESGDLVVTKGGVLQKNYPRTSLKKRLFGMYDKIATRVILQELMTEDLPLDRVNIVELSHVILKMVMPNRSVSYFSPFINEFLYISKLPVAHAHHDMFPAQAGRQESDSEGEQEPTTWENIRNLAKDKGNIGRSMVVVFAALAFTLWYFNGEGGVGLSYQSVAVDHIIILGLGVLFTGWLIAKLSIPTFQRVNALNRSFIKYSIKKLITNLEQKRTDESLDLRIKQVLGTKYISELKKVNEKLHSGKKHENQEEQNKEQHAKSLSLTLTSLKGFLQNEGIRTPASLNLLLRFNSFETSVDQIIEKWGGKSASERAMGAGFLTYSNLLIPFYKRIAHLFGNSHFFRALEKGINPFTVIESEVRGEPGPGHYMRVGGGLFNYGLTLKQKEQRDERTQAIDALHLKMRQMESLSRLISIRALINRPLTSEGDFRIPEGEILDKLKDENFQLRFEWVSRQLMNHIKQTEGSKTEESTSWDTETMQSYYNRALEFSEQSLTLESSVIADIKERLLQKVHSIWDSAMHWNQLDSDLLRTFLPSEQVKNTFMVQLIMDHLTIASIPFAGGLTPRGDLSIASIESMGLVPGGLDRFLFGFSSDAHFVEVILNVVAHVVISGRSQLMNIHELLEKYPPASMSNEYVSGSHIEEIEKVEQTLPKYFGGLFHFAFASGGEKRGDVPENALNDHERRIDAGYQFHRFMMKYYQYAQAAIISFIIFRFAFTDAGFSDAVLGSVFFLVGGFLTFGWPQILHLLYNNQYLKRKLDANTQDLTSIWQGLVHLKTGVLGSKKQELEAIKSGVKIIVQMYFNNRRIGDLLKHLKDVESNALKKIFLREIYEQRNAFSHSFSTRVDNMLSSLAGGLEGSQEISEKDYHQILLNLKAPQSLEQNLLGKLLKNRHIPAKMSEYGNILAALVAMGIFSNLAFVYLSVDSYEKNTLDNTLTWLGATLGLMFLLKKAYEYTGTQWRQKWQNLSLRKQILFPLATAGIVAGVTSPFYVPYDITGDQKILDSLILSYGLWGTVWAVGKVKYIASLKKNRNERSGVLPRVYDGVRHIRNKCSELFSRK